MRVTAKTQLPLDDHARDVGDGGEGGEAGEEDADEDEGVAWRRRCEADDGDDDEGESEPDVTQCVCVFIDRSPQPRHSQILTTQLWLCKIFYFLS